jgi:putative oxygen-independent coproporphyrinogen III oxidase
VDRGRGVYVHIPFCVRRCDYCDFTTYADREDAIPAYVEALVAHIRRVGAALPPGTRLGSAFVGGGTPTHLPPDDLAHVLAAVRRHLPLDDGAEWTVEANPETVDDRVAEVLAGGAVTRVSLGAQSFDPAVLRTLGRWHDPASVASAVERLRRAGIGRLSVDLIYGSPGETDASWAATLDRALDLGVTHVSAYALTVEEGTPYAARARRSPALLPDEDVQARRMEQADRRLSAAGLSRYEISNWAVPGEECRHNLTYWRGGEWLAFGSGAHGAWDGRRWWLLRDPGRYARAVAEGREPLGGEEHPTAEEIRLERLVMGLRVAEGVERADLEPLDAQVLDRLTRRGLVRAEGARLRLTPPGMALAGQVALALA